MDQTTRNHLQRATQDARRLLEAEFAAQLEGDLRRPARRPDPPRAGYAPRRPAAARPSRDRRGNRPHPSQGGRQDEVQAIDDYTREAAFTSLNRFVALKMLEARGLVQQCVSKGDQSGGFKEFSALRPAWPTCPIRAISSTWSASSTSWGPRSRSCSTAAIPPRCSGRVGKPCSTWSRSSTAPTGGRLGPGRDDRLGLPVLQRPGGTARQMRKEASAAREQP